MNEKRFVNHKTLEVNLFAVADGLSGHTGGAIASKMAVDRVRRFMGFLVDKICRSVSKEESLSIPEELEHLFFLVNKDIERAASETTALEYMGTTLSILLLYEDEAYIAHVGDSRVYLLRNKRTEKITYDDTVAQLSVDMGFMSKESAHRHPLRHSLIQALGQGVDEVHLYAKAVERGDIFLLCTDGLYNELSNDDMKEMVLKDNRVDLACEKLVDAALDAGGKDDITVIVVQSC